MVQSGGDEEKAARAKLEPHLEKVSFRAAQIGPGKYLSDSDALIAHFAGPAGVDPAPMPTLQTYIAGPPKGLLTQWQENVQLKAAAK